jgi:hypothetical protein
MDSNSEGKSAPLGLTAPIAQGSHVYLALHTLGWKAFQDLCAQICEVVLNRPVSIYREAQDGGQDAAFSMQAVAPSTGPTGGTVQCKFVSSPTKRLKIQDLDGELDNIRDLVGAGLADTYYFITSMGVDAPVAAAIRAQLQSLGVRDVEVFGREWITLKVRESARLRALVPRLYGIGDLSVILEERRAQQTQALLGHLMPSLKTYVPTAAHRQAVRILGECGIVLLVGAPATGKSMIAAILATTVLGGEGHRSFQLDGPGELTQFWNPNETGRFYWIDDAFGAQQLRDDYVEQWIAVMNRVKTAISAGNRFVLTSRHHIWRAAKPRLGIRNHQKLADESAVVNVGALSPEERAQILYNHIKEGNQAHAWKTRVKRCLDEISSSATLLPEIARRLGDRSYTAGIRNIPTDIFSFISRPTSFLKETLKELTVAQRAALTVIFLYRSRFPSHTSTDPRISLVCDKFGVKHADISDALNELDGSFILKKSDGDSRIWMFAHPTIADALAEILRDRPDLLEVYIHGARGDELLSEVVCAGSTHIRDAIVVPASANDLLVSRILELPDEQGLNRTLFSFLAHRASDDVLRDVVEKDSSILKRTAEHYWKLSVDGRIALFARLHEMHLLPADLRAEVADDLESALFHDFDGSLLEDDRLLALIAPSRLLSMSMRLYDSMKADVPGHIESIVSNADLTIEPSDNFDDMTSFLGTIRSVFSSVESVTSLVSDLEGEVTDGIATIAEKKQDSSTDWEGEDIAPSAISAPSGGRSIFSDLDS